MPLQAQHPWVSSSKFVHSNLDLVSDPPSIDQTETNYSSAVFPDPILRESLLRETCGQGENKHPLFPTRTLGP